MKIDRVWILSVLQLINFIFLFCNTYWVMYDYSWSIDSCLALCPLFIWVGLMGGGSYVNVMHNILQSDELE